MNDAEKELKKIVDAANLDYFNKKGARMEFKREFFKSWVLLNLLRRSIMLLVPNNIT